MQEPKTVEGVDYYLEHRDVTAHGVAAWFWRSEDGDELELTRDELHEVMSDAEAEREEVRDQYRYDGKSFTER